MEHISQFQDFTSCFDKQTAIAFIRGNGNNLEAAVSAYYDNPDPNRYRSQNAWDEGAFTSNREGAVVHGPVNQCHPCEAFTVGDSAPMPPSRPPSRTQVMNQQTQMPPSYGKTSEEVWDMTSGKTEFEGEDEAMRQSMAAFQNSSAGRGTVDYSELEALCLLNSLFSEEIVPDADLSNRVRAVNEPAFLKPLVIRDFLPALITVLHSIRRCRNRLLSTQHYVNDYGNNAHWWSGESIQTSTITYHPEEGLGNDSAAPPQPARPIEIELQRLMAFLDKTERSYGSAESLTRVPPIAQDGRTSASFAARFMKAWDDVRPHEPLFRTVISGLQTSGASDRQDIRLFEIDRPSIAINKVVSLYEALDNTLWTLQSDGTFDLNHFAEDIAPVMTFQIGVHNARKVYVPAELFVDRYLLANRDKLQAINKQNEVNAQHIKNADSILEKILKMPVAPQAGQPASNKHLDAPQALKHTLEYLQAREKEQQGTPQAEKTARAIQQLEKVMQRIDERVNELNEQKEKMQAEMAAFSSYLTREEDGPCHRYSLRGVAQSSFRNTTVYAKFPDPQSPKQDRWWRMAYDTGASSATVSKSVVARTDVYEAAGKGIDKTFLVYVRDDLLDDTPNVPLPESLQAFVERDNADFKQELQIAAESMEMDQQTGTIEDYSAYQTRRSRKSSGSSTKVHLGEDEGMVTGSLELTESDDVHMRGQQSQANEEMRDRGGSMFLGAPSRTKEQGGENDMETDSSPEPERIS